MLLLAAVALTGCRIAEHGRRAAIDAFASFVLDSVSQMQRKAPLTQARVTPMVAAATPAPPTTAAAWPPHSTSPSPLPIRIVSINLAPARVELCRIKFDAARMKVEARMAMAEARGGIDVRGRRRIVVVADPAAAL